MSRIDRYLRAIENDELDDYYYHKAHPHAKQFKYTKGLTNKRTPGKYYGRGKNRKI